MTLQAFCNVPLKLYSWIVGGREPGKARRAHLHTKLLCGHGGANAESMWQISDFPHQRSVGFMRPGRKYTLQKAQYFAEDGPKPTAAIDMLSSARPTFFRPLAGGKDGTHSTGAETIYNRLVVHGSVSGKPSGRPNVCSASRVSAGRANTGAFIMKKSVKELGFAVVFGIICTGFSELGGKPDRRPPAGPRYR